MPMMSVRRAVAICLSVGPVSVHGSVVLPLNLTMRIRSPRPVVVSRQLAIGRLGRSVARRRGMRATQRGRVWNPT